jgi:tetraacyldisaccharide 4'-kinase
MRVHERYPVWMRIYRGGPLSVLLSPVLSVASSLYGVYLSMGRGSSERRRARREGTKGALVISIGNLEVGGAGKTPCVLALAETLRERGQRPVVVTRGYGSEAERGGCCIVAAAGIEIGERGLRFIERTRLGGRVVGSRGGLEPLQLARLIGDEAVLFRDRGIPVVVESNRLRGFGIAEGVFEPTHILLDDAFQHRRAPRDTDILLLDASRPFGNGRLLPKGTLRERPEAVRRADVILFTRAEGDRIPGEALSVIEGKRIFFSSHLPVGLFGRGEVRLPTEHLRGKRVALFSGIARPESFEEMVRSAGIEPVVSMRFADHHSYTDRDVEWIMSRAEPDCMLVTTEKDWVKAVSLFPRGAEPLALRIKLEIRGLDRLLEIIGEP